MADSEEIGTPVEPESDALGSDKAAEPVTPAEGAEQPTEATSSSTEGDKPVVEQPGEATPNGVPENWRELMAGEDKKLAKLLERVPDFAALGKRVLEQENLIRSAAHRKPLGDNPTEKELADFRKNNGIPEKPDGYLEHLNGLVLEEQDQEAAADFLQQMHAANADPAVVRNAFDWYYKSQEAKQAAEVQRDREFRTAATDELRLKMGPDYTPNMQDLKNWVPPEVGDLLWGARLTDGTLLGDNPAALEFLIGQMRELNPLMSPLPGGNSGASGLSVSDEVKAIGDSLKTKEGYEKYWGSPDLQKRYSELLEIQEKQAARAR